MVTLDTAEREYRCLALRRVNPFRGVLQLVSTPQAQAVSSDGRRWELQVRAQRPADLWGGQGTRPTSGLFRFGLWSADQGLEGVPVNPILNNTAIIPAAEQLLGILQRVHRQTPFPEMDRLECWLLDADSRPLALIATALPESEQPREPAPAGPWLATLPDLPGALSGYARGLEERIAQAAGAPPRSGWLRRESDGSGLALAPRQSPGPLPPEAFPEVLFRDPAPSTTAEAEAFLSWLAPRLLTLAGLSDASRSRLEQLGRRHALALAALWRLYPKIVHPELINSARVEADIRLAARPPRPTQ
jgi:hypothetical protein